jgi:hypothetical protein
MSLSLETARVLMQSHVDSVTEPATRPRKRNRPGLALTLALLLIAGVVLALPLIGSY